MTPSAALSSPLCVALLCLSSACDRSPSTAPATASAPSAADALPLGSAQAKRAATGSELSSHGPLQVDEPLDLQAQPVLAVFQSNPWADVIGAELPAFVLYRDGTVISAVGAKEPGARSTGQLSDAAEFSAKVFAALLPEEARTTLSQVTDQPSVAFLARSKDGWIQRTVYGMRLDCTASGPGRSSSKPIASGILSACKQLQSATIRQPKPWVPSQIEVMLWGFEHSKVQPVPWPSALPPPPAVAPPKSGTIKHPIDAKYLPRLQVFLASLKPGQAALFAGHKWSISQRAVIPADAYLREVRQQIWARYADSLKQKRR